MSNKYIQKMLGNTDRLGSRSALNECGSIALVQEKVESVKQVFFYYLNHNNRFSQEHKLKNETQIYACIV